MYGQHIGNTQVHGESFLTQVAVLQKLRSERGHNLMPGTIAVSSTTLQEKANLLMPKVLQGCVELCT